MSSVLVFCLFSLLGAGERALGEPRSLWSPSPHRAHWTWGGERTPSVRGCWWGAEAPGAVGHGERGGSAVRGSFPGLQLKPSLHPTPSTSPAPLPPSSSSAPQPPAPSSTPSSRGSTRSALKGELWLFIPAVCPPPGILPTQWCLWIDPATPVGPRGRRGPPTCCDGNLPLTQIHPPPCCVCRKFSFGLRPSLQKVPVNCTCYLEWTAH